MCYLKLQNISKIYASGNEPVTALSSISLNVDRGEFIAITGPSGCGKSTLLHILGGLSKPSDGRVYVQGRSLYNQKPSELALFTELNRQEKTTIVLVTHDDDVARWARRRVYMADGKIIKDERIGDTQ